MKKIKTFYDGNKPFVIIATLFVLFGTIFNDKLTNVSNQVAQVFILTPIPVIQSSTPPYNQYPSLSNSGFYLENKVNGSGNYYQALTGTKSTMTDTAKDIKILTADYYASGCSTITSDTCTTKLNTILNSLYTYATYSTSYEKLSYENTKAGVAVINDKIDWAGIAANSVLMAISNRSSISSIDLLLSNISIDTKRRVTTAISTGSLRFSPPLASVAVDSLRTLINKNKLASKSDGGIKTLSVLNKSQNSATVILAKATVYPTINSFTVNSLATNIAVKQGSSITVDWSTSNTTNCYAMGGEGSGWTGNLKSTSPYPRPTVGSVTLTMNNSIGQIFTLNCYGNNGTIEKKLTVDVMSTTVVAPVGASVSKLVTTEVISPSVVSTFVSASPISVVSMSGPAVAGTPTITTVSGPISVGTPTISVGVPTLSQTPIVGPLPSKLYVNPYLFVFGINPLGNTEFKILNKNTAGDSVSRFGQINGSAGEIDETTIKLDIIALYIGSTPLTESKMSVTLNKARFKTTNNYSSGAGTKTIMVPRICPIATPSSKQISENSIHDLELKMVKLGNNQTVDGLTPEGETGVVANVLTNGKVLATVFVGINGKVTTNVENALNQMNNEYNGCIDYVYIAHTHDKNSMSENSYGLWCCLTSSGKKTGEDVTFPSVGDLVGNYYFQTAFQGKKIVDIVFAPSGKGWKFEVPKYTNGNYPSPEIWKSIETIALDPMGEKSKAMHADLWNTVIKARQDTMKKNNHALADQTDDKIGSLAGISKLREWGVVLTEVVAGK
jgi:hypothetical protein